LQFRQLEIHPRLAPPNSQEQHVVNTAFGYESFQLGQGLFTRENFGVLSLNLPWNSHLLPEMLH
jgi:hypothetical protein